MSRSIGSAAITVVLPGVVFAAIPFGASLGVVAYRIFCLNVFDDKFGPWGAFRISGDLLLAVWAFNALIFVVAMVTLRAVTNTRPPFRRLLTASAVVGAVMSAVVLLVHPLSLWVWVSAGPIGAPSAFVLGMKPRTSRRDSRPTFPGDPGASSPPPRAGA